MCAVALGASAYDEIQVKPTTVTANKLSEVKIYLNSSTYNECMKYLEFDLILPDGWTFGATPVENYERTGEWDDDEEVYVSNMSIDFGRSNNKLHFMMYANDPDFPLHGSEGHLVSIKIKAPAGTAEGIYPLVIKGGAYMCKSSVDAENVVWDEDQISYVKIGTPTEASLTATGVIPSFVNEALANEAAITSLDLSAVTAVNGTFTYVDGRDVVAPTADVAVTAAYKKAVAAGKYASLTMPFAADLTGKGAYVLNNVTGDVASFDEAHSVNAGDVVLLTQSIELEGTKLGAATKSVQSSAYYVAPDGQSLHKGTNVTVPALRGYWNVGGGASNLRIALDGVLTDINLIDVQGEGAQAFDLQGRQVQSAKNGVFVVNGKKQFVK